MSKWTDAEIAAMESDDYWDIEHGELVVPRPEAAHSSVFAVRLARDDARRIGYAAEQAGQNVIEFIRQAAIERAAQYPAPPARAPRRIGAEGA